MHALTDTPRSPIRGSGKSLYNPPLGSEHIHTGTLTGTPKWNARSCTHTREESTGTYTQSHRQSHAQSWTPHIPGVCAHTHTHVTLTTCCTVVQGSVIVIFGFSSPHTVRLTCPHPHHQGDTPASPCLPTTRAPARASSSWRWDTESTKCRERNGPGSLFQAAGKWKISA